jgi:two-component system response regulator GlrR
MATTGWPGEVQNLFSLVKQSVVLEAANVPSYEEARQQFTRDYLVTNLQHTHGNISESARVAKRNRTDFYKLLSRFRVSADDFKPDRHVSRHASTFKGERIRRT